MPSPATANPSPSPSPNSSPNSDEAPSSVSGDAWALFPLALAALLLRTLGEHTWAYVVAAVLGGVGLLGALIGLGVCVGALRRGPARARGKAAWVAFLLLAGCFVVINRLITTW